MRTGGIQGSQGPSVERQTEMANGGGGGLGADGWTTNEALLSLNHNTKESV